MAVVISFVPSLPPCVVAVQELSQMRDSLVSVWQNTGFVAYETASANWDASFNFSLQKRHNFYDAIGFSEHRTNSSRISERRDDGKG